MVISEARRSEVKVEVEIERSRAEFAVAFLCRRKQSNGRLEAQVLQPCRF